MMKYNTTTKDWVSKHYPLTWGIIHLSVHLVQETFVHQENSHAEFKNRFSKKKRVWNSWQQNHRMLWSNSLLYIAIQEQVQKSIFSVLWGSIFRSRQLGSHFCSSQSQHQPLQLQRVLETVCAEAQVEGKLQEVVSKPDIGRLAQHEHVMCGNICGWLSQSNKSAIEKTFHLNLLTLEELT